MLVTRGEGEGKDRERGMPSPRLTSARDRGGHQHVVPETFNTHSNLCSHRSFAVYCGLELDRKERALLERRGGGQVQGKGEGDRHRQTQKERQSDRAPTREIEEVCL